MRFLIVIFALVISGCETARLWSGSGAEYVKVIPRTPDEDVESELKQSGRGYFCQQLYESSYPNNKVCYATLTKEDKIRNIEIKLKKTPETLVNDAGQTIKVIGSVALDVLMHMNIRKG